METLKDLKGKEFWNACSEGNLEKPKELYNQPNDVINWSNPNYYNFTGLLIACDKNRKNVVTITSSNNLKSR